MNIMIYDIAAEYGGAETVLRSYYERARLDSVNFYYFVVSRIILEETDNISVIYLMKTYKNWIGRILIDNLIMPQKVRKLKVDKIISLQNTIIPHVNVYQDVYVHNVIPFSEYSFSITMNVKLWVYQKIIGRIIVNSIRKANKVIVQTDWMKEAIIRKCGIHNEKVQIEPILINIEVHKMYSKQECVSFFYPASPEVYKNHVTLIKALALLQQFQSRGYRVVLTIQKDELPRVWQRRVNENRIPIDFVGRIDFNEMQIYYQKSVLIFPSYLETIGLPLIEAMQFSCPIIVADCEYSRFALRDYNNVNFFPPFDEKLLAKLLMVHID